MGVQGVTGIRYLGGVIGDQDSEKAWLTENVTGWVDSVEVLVGVARQQPHTAYAGLKKSLQNEWYSLQHITLTHRGGVLPGRVRPGKSLLPALFKGSTTEVPM